MDKFIKRAISLAYLANDHQEFPVGAVVFKNDITLGEGYNQKEGSNDPSGHAEILALRQAAHHQGDWRLTGASLVTTLEPCPMCLGAILQSRIKTVIYLAKDIRWGACGSVMDFSHHPKLNHRCELLYRPNDEVVQMMKDFFKVRRLKK